MRGLPWGEFAGRRGDWGRSLYLWAVRRYGGVTLREAGVPVGGADDQVSSSACLAFPRF